MRQLHAVGVAWRRVGIEREILTDIDFDRSVLECAEAQFRTLQIDQDADRPAMFGFDSTDRVTNSRLRSGLVWLILMRNTPTPAANSRLIVTRPDEAGPRV